MARTGRRRALRWRGSMTPGRRSKVDEPNPPISAGCPDNRLAEVRNPSGALLDRDAFADCAEKFAVHDVAPVVGMGGSFLRKVLGSKPELTAEDVLVLLDQDGYAETFVPRSRVLDYL